jgi:3-oxoacyl-[acyl-carrier-protein] synthase II
MDHSRAVAVTGIGMFTSVGNNHEEFWNSIINGKSGIRKIQSFDPSGHKTQIASEVQNYSPENYFDRKEARKMSRGSQFAASAAIDAIKDAGIDLDLEDRYRIGSVIGSAAGDFYHLEDQHERFLKMGPGSVNPMTVPRVIPNMPVCSATMALGIYGPTLGVTAACSTGTHSIGMALGIIRSGMADVMLAGASEACLTGLILDSYSSMGVLSTRNEFPEKASRPFDLGRDGFVIAEGACVMVLESLEHARKRGAKIIALLSGFAMTVDSYSIAAPEPSGIRAAKAMELAIKDAGLSTSDIGYINAHGTSTKLNDKTETLAIKKAFDGLNIPVSSTKSMIGHALGAAGAIEAAATLLAVHHGVLPPTINQEEADPECDMDVIPNTARKSPVKAAISNSFGFGGQNGVLLFEKA